VRPRKLRMKGVGRFTDVEIDFASIPGNIIAISGLTGQGKTMTIESIFAAHHRNFPSRPDSIYKYCHGKDSQIELEFINKGIIYRSLINIDAVGAEMESYLFEGDKPLNDGKAKTFKEVITRLFGSESLILSSSFSAQNHKGSFIRLAKTDRKSLFIAMINQVVLEKISGKAKANKESCDSEYSSLSTKLEALDKIRSQKVPNREAISLRLDYARNELITGDQILRELQTKLSMEKAKIETGARSGEKSKLLHAKQLNLTVEIHKAESELAGTQSWSASLESLKLAAEGIEEEMASLQKLKDRVEDWRGEVSEKERMETEYLQAAQGIQNEISDNTRLGEVAKSKLERALKDAKIIKVVPCKAEGDFAKCPLLVNAVEGKDSIDPLTGEIDGAKAKCLALDDKIAALVRPTAGIKEALRKKIADEKPKIDDAARLINQKLDAKGKIPRAESAAERASDLEKQLEKLKSASAEMSDELAQLEAEDREREAGRAKVRSLQSQVDMQDELIGSIRDRISAAERELSQADLLAQQWEQAKKEMDPIRESIDRVNLDRRSWDLLAKAFGKTGIQSLEIDVAGPEVSAICNDLLSTCFGTRFSVKFRTQRPMSDGSGFTDDFDVHVFDTNRGEWCSIDDLSGGEQVVVGEAVSLAIALFNRQKSNVGWETIFRDEPSSALDDENAPRYVSMLSKARELGHFDILYLISHQNSVKELCDSRINISNGRIEIQA